MRRPSPDISIPSWQPPAQEDGFTLHLRLITPLFGGGYESREVDPVCIIRPATVRGHLRYWWRALYGGQFSNAKELFKAEAHLWGAAALEKHPATGKVRLQVTQVRSGGNTVTIDNFKPRGSPARVGPEAQYLLYPFQAQRQQNLPPAKGYPNVEFTLHVSFDKSLSASQRQQVENALKAWIAFGGIGGRTRRGCGALTVTKEQGRWLPPADVERRKQWFRQLLPAGEPPKPPRLAHLSGARIVCGNPTGQAVSVLHDLGSFWAAFRKGHVGSKPYTPMEGCRWSDYRKELLRFNRLQGSTISLAKPFFGLPIVYQSFRNAPYAPTIESSETGRMASPVILKPLALANGQVCPMCVVLWAPVPTSVRIKPPDQQVKLAPPQQDAVLNDLQVRHPLEAVVKAAEAHWKTKAFGLGGG